MRNSLSKVLYIIFSILTFTSSVGTSQAAIESSSSSSSSSDKTKSFSENQIGVGFFVGYEIDLINGVFLLDEEDEAKKADDKIFNSVEIFYNHFGDAIDQNYGASYSLGYSYKKFGVFANTGYIATNLTYIEDSSSQSMTKTSGFVGGGLSYKIKDNLKAKLSFMNYSVSFTPQNSAYNKVKLGVRTITATMGYNF